MKKKAKRTHKTPFKWKNALAAVAGVLIVQWPIVSADPKIAAWLGNNQWVGLLVGLIIGLLTPFYRKETT